MREKVWIWTAFYLLVYVLQTFAQTNLWAPMRETVEKRVVRVQALYADESFGGCSGTVINKERGIVLTCQHCVRGAVLEFAVNGAQADVVKQSLMDDLAILQSDDLDGVEDMALAGKSPETGDDIALVGFAFSATQHHWQFGRVSLPLRSDGFMMLDVTSIKGQSGGPAINAAGELVGISKGFQVAGGHLAMMVPLDKVRRFVSKFLPETK
jgi:S1-C subfamily serine protease